MLQTTMNKYPMLSLAEEQQLFEKYQRENCLESAHKIALSHLYLVKGIAKRYQGYKVEFDDLMMEGFHALLIAIKKFDLSRGVRFCVFAAYDVKSRISEFVLKNYSIINLGTTKEDRKLFFNRAIVNNSSDVTGELNVTQKQLEHFEEKFKGHKTSVALDDDTTVLQLPSPYKGPEEAMHERDEERQVEALKAAVAALDERTRVILESRHLTASPVPLRELAERFGVSAARVEQIEKKALKELKSLFDGV